MARRLRVQGKGFIHHIIARGNRKADIFNNVKDKEKYKEIIRRYKARYGFKLYAYCLMNNHIHLLLEEGDYSLGKIMQGIQQSYTQYINKKNETTGHVFEQRYKSMLCSDDAYFEKLVAYIHINPVKAGYVPSCDLYRWSGHGEIVSGNEDLIDLSDLYRLIGGGQEGLRRYMAIINNHNSVSDESIKDEYYSDDELEDKKIVEKYVEAKNESFEIDLDDLAEAVRKAVTQKNYMLYKRVFVPVAYECSDHKRYEVAKYLDISPSNASNIYRDYREGKFSEYIMNIIDEVVDSLS